MLTARFALLMRLPLPAFPGLSFSFSLRFSCSNLQGSEHRGVGDTSSVDNCGQSAVQRPKCGPVASRPGMPAAARVGVGSHPALFQLLPKVCSGISQRRLPPRHAAAHCSASMCCI